jgi:hypothetical protein
LVRFLFSADSIRRFGAPLDGPRAFIDHTQAQIFLVVSGYAT